MADRDLAIFIGIRYPEEFDKQAADFIDLLEKELHPDTVDPRVSVEMSFTTGQAVGA